MLRGCRSEPTRFIHYTLWAVSGPWCHSRTRPVTFLKWSQMFFSVTFWTLILQGFFISPSIPLLILLDSFKGIGCVCNLGYAGPRIFFVSVLGRGDILWSTVTLGVTVCAHSAFLPKSASLLTFSGCRMSEWSSRSSVHLPRLFSIVTFH